jgi:hypothetical protein
MLGVSTLDDSSGGTVGVPATAVLTAQQTNLVRSVLDAAHRLELTPFRDPRTGRKSVSPLDAVEFSRFRAAWERAPVECIRSMNRAISRLKEPRRLSRYLEAAVDLEILMDHERPHAPSVKELLGVPSYLVDGYTDLGIHGTVDPMTSRERIFVDKESLRLELLSSKRQALVGLSGPDVENEQFEAVLLEIARSLRESLGYDENDFKKGRDEDTVMLSKSVMERSVNCRHLAILFQLRLQEAGVSSRLVKGMLRLFGLKLRHVWNVATEGRLVALVDVALGEDELPLVLTGGSDEEVDQKAAERNRTYCPSPDSFHRYQIRSVPRNGGH